MSTPITFSPAASPYTAYTRNGEFRAAAPVTSMIVSPEPSKAGLGLRQRVAGWPR